MDCGLPGFSVHGIPGRNTGVGCHFFLQKIFLIQGLNLGLLHCRQILYWLSYEGSPLIQQEGARKASSLAPWRGGKQVPYVWWGWGPVQGLGWRGSWGGVPTPLVVLYPAFAPSSSEVAFGFLVFLHLLVHNLPQLCMHTVICSPSEFVFVALEDICPGASTAAKGSKSQVLACLCTRHVCVCVCARVCVCTCVCMYLKLRSLFYWMMMERLVWNK